MPARMPNLAAHAAKRLWTRANALGQGATTYVAGSGGHMLVNMFAHAHTSGAVDLWTRMRYTTKAGAASRVTSHVQG